MGIMGDKEMKTKNWTKIQPFGPEAYTYWINGIYKIVSYDKGEYLAYFIPDHYDNWGNHVSEPLHNGKSGKVWNSFKAATDACKSHARVYDGSKSTIDLADRIKTKLIEQYKEYSKEAVLNMTNKKMKHTELPWYIEYPRKDSLNKHSVPIVTSKGADICDFYYTNFKGPEDVTPIFTNYEANAEFICKAVNNHEKLVNMVKELQTEVWNKDNSELANKAQALLNSIETQKETSDA